MLAGLARSRRACVEHVTYVDTSPGMLALARERAQQWAARHRAASRAWPAATYLQGDEDGLLPVEPGSFDRERPRGQGAPGAALLLAPRWPTGLTRRRCLLAAAAPHVRCLQSSSAAWACTG